MPIRIISFGGHLAICLPLRKIGFPIISGQPHMAAHQAPGWRGPQ